MPPREEVIQAESVKYPDFSLNTRKKENAWLCNNKKKINNLIKINQGVLSCKINSENFFSLVVTKLFLSLINSKQYDFKNVKNNARKHETKEWKKDGRDGKKGWMIKPGEIFSSFVNFCLF